MQQVLAATDVSAWRALLAKAGEVDPSFLPEYHQAYSLRIRNSTPLLWHYEGAGGRLLYPFLLTPVIVEGEDTGYRDLSGIYGYTGPLATSSAPELLAEAWRAFDAWAEEQKVIAEFVRFSPFNRTERFAHPQTRVEANRDLAVSELPGEEEALLRKLGAKTRNMLRKAERAGLSSRELALPDHLSAFRRLYEETMSRNQAPEFFWYDDAYYGKLLALGKDGLRLFGVFAGDRLVAASMAVVHGKAALYHLGASLMEFAKQGAGNLSLYQMSRDLMRSGVAFVNMTGGRTTSPDDPLLLFKRSNATGTAPFHIGKRVVDPDAYRSVGETWRRRSGRDPDPAKILFWRP